MLPACASSFSCKLAPAAQVELSHLIFLQLTVQSWRLAWNFTDGEVLAEAADYFPNTSYPLPGSFNTSHVEIQSTSLTADDAQQAVQNAWFYPAQVRAPRCLSCCMCITIPSGPEFVCKAAFQLLVCLAAVCVTAALHPSASAMNLVSSTQLSVHCRLCSLW